MFRAIIQNSFLAFTEVEELTCKKRSRSVDSVVGKQSGEVELEKSVVSQLDRFDKLLNAGFTAPETEELVTKPALETAGKMPCKLGLSKRIASNSSVSTMAPDDDEDEFSTFSHLPGLGGLKPVASSGSMFSMISEDEETSFDGLDSSNDHSDGLPGGLQERSTYISQTPLAKSHVHTATSTRSPVDDFSHCHVPRLVNLAQQFETKADKAAPTTIMIRNIPNRHTQAQIMKELESLGFAGTFDFFYAPMDKCTRCTVGYAFVNFLEPQVAARCMKAMENHWFSTHGRQRAKQARVSIAHLQGFEANLKHYKDAAVNNGPNDGMRGPVIMPSLARSLGAW